MFACGISLRLKSKYTGHFHQDFWKSRFCRRCGNSPGSRTKSLWKMRDSNLRPLAYGTALKGEPSKDLVDFVNLSLWTGARRGDVLSLRWQDVSLDDNSWRIPDPKSRVPYTVPLTPEAVAVLKGRRNDSTWVFPGVGKTGHLVDLKRPWKGLLKRAAITNLRQHDMRRTLGSWQAAQGTSLQIIGKSLGHASVQTTQIYARLNLDPVRASVGAATKAMIAATKKKPAKQKPMSQLQAAEKHG